MKKQFKLNVNESILKKIRIYGCHTQAVMSSSKALTRIINPAFFELITTIPFGIRHVNDNPNRLIDSITDPDIGINIAFDLLGIDCSYKYYPKNDISMKEKAIDSLIRMVQAGPVIIGPVNMGLLPYYYNNFQYHGIDHYLVAIDYSLKADQIILMDTERVGVVSIRMDDFIPSWLAKDLIEGNGAFTMRQIRHVPTEFNLEKIWDKVLKLAAKNIEATSIQSLKDFSSKTINKRKDSSLWHGLYFCITNRIRKLLCYHLLLLNLYMAEDDLIDKIQILIENQIKECLRLIKKLNIYNQIIPYEIEEILEIELKIGLNLYKVLCS
jgi:hypothetical protein